MRLILPANSRWRLTQGGNVRTPVSEGKLFYHVTDLDNMQSIFQCGLLSRNDAFSNGLIKKDVANPEIIAKRRELGILSYVPFHFFEKTPFTWDVIHDHPGDSFCAITVLRAAAKARGWKICPAHPLSLDSADMILDYDDGMRQIDWGAMDNRYFQDQHSKEVCMAECLAPSPVPPSDFFAIYVADESAKQMLTKLKEKLCKFCSFYINVNPIFCRQ